MIETAGKTGATAGKTRAEVKSVSEKYGPDAERQDEGREQ